MTLIGRGDRQKACEMRNELSPNGQCRYTLQEIADTFGVSRQRIGAIVGQQGWRNGAARLCADKEKVRKAAYGDRVKTIEEIAEEYGIGVLYVKKILRSRTQYEYDTGFRRCNTCGKLKCLSTDFYPVHTAKHARMKACKECDKARSKQWVTSNHKRFLKQRRDYTRTAAYKAYRKRWYAEHRKEVNAANRARYWKKKAEKGEESC